MNAYCLYGKVKVNIKKQEFLMKFYCVQSILELKYYGKDMNFHQIEQTMQCVYGIILILYLACFIHNSTRKYKHKITSHFFSIKMMLLGKYIK